MSLGLLVILIPTDDSGRGEPCRGCFVAQGSHTPWEVSEDTKTNFNMGYYVFF